MKPVHHVMLYVILIALDALLAVQAFRSGNTAGAAMFSLGILVWAGLLLHSLRSRT